MKKVLKKEKAITLISLIVAVTIMIIISALLIYNARTGLKIRTLNMMENDISILDDKVNAYYVKYGALPIEIKYNVNPLPFENTLNPNDSPDGYYVLDLEAFEGLTLNYGADFKNVTEENVADYNDLYIINEQSFQIYYVKGIEMDEVMYYTNDIAEEIKLVELGNYLLNNTTYFDTLVEAVAAAKDGSTIKVLKDTEETESVTIDKDITLDMNGKTIDYNATDFLTIEDNKNVQINGKGTFDGSLEINEANLEINEINLDYISGNGGNVTLNNSEANYIQIFTPGIINIDGGECRSVRSYGAEIIIDNAIIGSVDLGKGGQCTINSEQIENISLSTDGDDINLTIGDINEEVNINNPSIEKIDKIAPDLTGIIASVNFYNGTIKECFFNLEDETGLGSLNHPYEFEYNIREGYRAETTTDGTILVKE